MSVSLKGLGREGRGNPYRSGEARLRRRGPCPLGETLPSLGSHLGWNGEFGVPVPVAGAREVETSPRDPDL